MNSCGLSPENIRWAVESADAGRSTEFIASVLGVKQHRVVTIIRVHGGVPVPPPCKREYAKHDGREYVWRASETDGSQARAAAEAYFKNDDESAENGYENIENVKRPVGRPPAQETRPDSTLRDRRRFLISARFARHWDLIWFNAARGMSWRTIMQHFGRDCVMWARGSGFEWQVPE